MNTSEEPPRWEFICVGCVRLLQIESKSHTFISHPLSLFLPKWEPSRWCELMATCDSTFYYYEVCVCVVGVFLRTLPRRAILFFELTRTHAPDIYLHSSTNNQRTENFCVLHLPTSVRTLRAFPLLFYLLTFVDLEARSEFVAGRYVGRIYPYRARSSNYKHLWSVRSCHLQRPRKLNTRQSIYCIEAFFDRRALTRWQLAHTSFDPQLWQ